MMRMYNRMLILGILLGLAHPALAGEIQWIKDYKQGLQTARATGKPMLVDFYTDW